MQDNRRDAALDVAGSTTRRGWSALLSKLFGGANRTGSVDAVLSDAALPEPLTGLVRDVARQTRLWSSERADVARELAAHFQGGLESGQSPQRLAERFGEVQQTALMIRRAKRRTRPLWWHSLRIVAWSSVACLMLLVAAHLVLLARMHLLHPTIGWNYRAEVNSRFAQVDPEDRAWPFYRQALVELLPLPEVDWDANNFDSADRRTIAAYLAEHEHGLQRLREAARRPRLGYRDDDPANQVLAQRHAGQPPQPLYPAVEEENPIVVSLLLGHLQDMRDLARLLRADLQVAVAENDRDRALADLVAIAQMSKQARDTVPVLVTDLVSLAILGSGVTEVADLLSERPAWFGDEALVQLAHSYAAPWSGTAARPQIEGERAMFRDLVQRAWSDNGRGDGVLTAEGVEVLRQFDVLSNATPGVLANLLHDPDVGLMVAPLVAATAPSRREAQEFIDRMFAAVEQDLSTPLAQVVEGGSVTERLATEMLQRSRLSPAYAALAMNFPAIATARPAVERYLAYRNALLLALALELYQRERGVWPRQLEELVPDYLPAIPRDPFAADAPLKYALVDGAPHVYSVGRDLDDDGGMPMRMDDQPSRLKFPYQKADGDWVLWPLAPPPDRPSAAGE